MLFRLLLVPAVLVIMAIIAIYFLSGKQSAENAWKFLSRGFVILAIVVITFTAVRYAGTAALTSGTLVAVDTGINGGVTNFGLAMIAIVIALIIVALIIFLSASKILVPQVKGLLEEVSKLK